MATQTLPEKPPELLGGETPGEARVDARLAGLEAAVERSAREGRNAGRAFMIFAVAALGIAMVTMVAVVAKLPDSASSSASSGAAARPAPATAVAGSAAASRSIAASLAEYTVTPVPAAGKAGRVTFTVRNAGSIKHEFVVLKTQKPAANLLKGAEADETGNVGEIGGINPGQTRKLTLALKPGHYALICNLPGHYTAGQ